MERTFTYRNGCIFFVAFWFGVLGLIFSGMAYNAMLSGHPLPTRLADGTEITTGPLSWLPVFLPLTAVPLCAWLFLFAMNSQVCLDSNGLRVYNWRKRLIFRAAWNDIISVHREYQRGGSYTLAIQTASHTEMVTRSLIDIEDLETAISSHLAEKSATP